MDNQISIFEYESNSIKKSIFDKLKHYGIDKIYIEKFKENNVTFYEMKNTFKKNKNYKYYLKDLSEELKKYIRLSNNIFEEFFEHKIDKSFQLNDDAIIIRTKNSIGPIFCITMIDNKIFEMEE